VTWARTGDDIVSLLRSVATSGQTILVATHADGVARACDRTLALADGLIRNG
jgi:ABC-type lipoprotein export system ATPase subunit